MSTDVDAGRRRFLTASVAVVGGAAVVGTAVPFVAAWQPSERARAIGAPIEVDISKLEPGQMLTAKWRGQPVWIVSRPPESSGGAAPRRRSAAGPGIHPESAASTRRTSTVPSSRKLWCSSESARIWDARHCVSGRIKPPLGIGWPGGFFCPCHGSKFDYAGRVYAGVPAPTNLVVPPHKYLSDTRILIGAGEESV